MLVLEPHAAVEMVLGTSRGMILRQLVLSGETRVHVEGFRGEVTSILAKGVAGGHISAKEAESVLEDACLVAGKLVTSNNVDGADWRIAMKLASRFDGALTCTGFEALMLAAALAYDATVFTLDGRLRKLCHEVGANCIEEVEF